MDEPRAPRYASDRRLAATAKSRLRRLLWFGLPPLAIFGVLLFAPLHLQAILIAVLVIVPFIAVVIGVRATRPKTGGMNPLVTHFERKRMLQDLEERRTARTELPPSGDAQDSRGWLAEADQPPEGRGPGPPPLPPTVQPLSR